MSVDLIFDTSGNPLTAISLYFEPDEVKTLPIVVLCLGGYKLFSDVVANMTVEARFAGVGSYINLETSQIDLTAYDGLYKDIDLRLTAGTAAHRVWNLKVERA